MKALSLRAPWSLLLASGVKRVETRGFRTEHRGFLLIHSGKAWGPDVGMLAVSGPFRPALESLGIRFTPDERAARAGWGIPLGAIVGRVTLVECFPTDRIDVVPELGTSDPVPAGGLFPGLAIGPREAVFGDYGPRRFGWLCADAVRFPRPIPWPGQLGLFDVPDDKLPPEYLS
jgi:hypothetical protein